MRSRQPGAPPLAYEAQLATLVDAPPEGPGWLHEQKFDGYRMGLLIAGDDVELWSRRNQDWTDAFPTIVAGQHGASVRGRPSSTASWRLFRRAASPASRLFKTGGPTRTSPISPSTFSLSTAPTFRRLPLLERKERLRELLGGDTVAAGGIIRFSDHVLGDGASFFAAACKLGLEGIVSKSATARYRPGRNADWLKTKCLERQEMVVGGFTDPEGSRAGVGSLLVGHWDGGELRWAGKVGTGVGWTGAFLTDLRRRLDDLAAATSPFTPPVSDPWLRRNAHWVRPELVVEVAFSEWTDDGRVRHASVQGVRLDKAAADVVPERALSWTGLRPRAPHAADADRPVVRGVRISHPARIVFADLGLSKLDVARYYDAVAEKMLPHVAGRPLTLLLCTKAVEPDADKGGCQMMRHGKAWGPPALRRVAIPELTKTGEYLVADSPEAIVSLAQMGVVELHTWNARAETPYLHDRVVVDLDPGPNVSFAGVIEGALLVRRMFEGLGLVAFPKTTGGRGLHVVAPIEPVPAAAALAFARAMASALVAHDGARFTTTVSKHGREAKILVDVLRNNRTNTSVAAFSLRARAGAPVSWPLAWDELTTTLTPQTFDQGTVQQMLTTRPDPWKDYATTRQRLPDLPKGPTRAR